MQQKIQQKMQHKCNKMQQNATINIQTNKKQK